MSKQVIFNLPVKDLEKSKAFFASLGFGFNPQFSNERAANVVIVEGSISAMLTTEDFFRSLIDKPVVQAKEANEVIICLMCESRDEVAGLVEKAVAAGGRSPHPLEDHGFMVTQGFEDLDGHLWNLVWMNPASRTSQASQ
ncbi:VOC family protein [Massilia sp. LXY-6]|uniref:VOC family protein n=1 Tax=Massilia sp. LXY-6 TaxID=3379823 RepID=UPI003EE3EADC